MFDWMNAHEDCERALIVERIGGMRLWHKCAMSAEQVSHAHAWLAIDVRPSYTARSMQVGRSTFYRALDVEKG